MARAGEISSYCEAVATIVAEVLLFCGLLLSRTCVEQAHKNSV